MMVYYIDRFVIYIKNKFCRYLDKVDVSISNMGVRPSYWKGVKGFTNVVLLFFLFLLCFPAFMWYRYRKSTIDILEHGWARLDLFTLQENTMSSPRYTAWYNNRADKCDWKKEGF